MNTNNGWKLVPVEPTPEMVKAAFDQFEISAPGFATGNDARRAIYAAMLAAAPAPPASAQDDAKDDGLAEAQSLAKALFQRHFAQDDDYASGRVKWKLLDDLPGVLSQIDNMVSGLVRPAAPAAGDALDTKRWRWVAKQVNNMKTSEATRFLELLGLDPGKLNAFLDEWVDAAIAQQKGEA